MWVIQLHEWVDVSNTATWMSRLSNAATWMSRCEYV